MRKSVPPRLPLPILLTVIVSLISLGGCVVAPPAIPPTPTTETTELVPTYTPTPASMPADPTPTPQPEAEAARAPDMTELLGLGAVNVPVLNLRDGPDLTYRILGTLQMAQIVSLLDRNRDGSWWLVCCLVDGVTSGWVWWEYLDFDLQIQHEVAGVLPVPTPSPVPTPTPTLAVNMFPSREELWEMTVTNTLGNLPDQRYSFPPTTNLNPLTGLPIAEERLAQRPLAVCIPSDVQARPQKGLSNADVVYEYLVDGNQYTRMTAIFYGQDAPLIGPIRSARLVNVYLGYLYNAATMCSGASDFIRRLLREMAEFPFFDIDLDNPNAILPYSLVIDSGLTRFHTTTQGMRTWLDDTSKELAMDLQGFQFGEPPPGHQPASYVKIPYPSVSSAWVEFYYDPGTGRYLRHMGGVPHLDKNSGAQLAVENVVVQYVPHVSTLLIEDSLGSRSLDQNIFGTGRAVVFRDGRMYEGTWTTDALGKLPTFHAGDSGSITLRPGQTWIALVPEGYLLTVN